MLLLIGYETWCYVGRCFIFLSSVFRCQIYVSLTLYFLRRVMHGSFILHCGWKSTNCSIVPVLLTILNTKWVVMFRIRRHTQVCQTFQTKTGTSQYKICFVSSVITWFWPFLTLITTTTVEGLFFINAVISQLGCNPRIKEGCNPRINQGFKEDFSAAASSQHCDIYRRQTKP